jgi:DNA-directed RNA polymerase subunit alpha
MARIPFQKPKAIQWEILSDRYGRLVAEPFEKGYAQTVGHSLRRTLLSIIPGSAVTWVRIAGLEDAGARIAGVQEDTMDVLLNLKKLAVNVPSGEPMETRLDATGPKEVTGADVSEATGVEVLNPELHIAMLESGASLAVELGIGVNRGYTAAGNHPAGAVPPGAIPMDAAFSPIQRVSYTVENARLGKITDYEKLILEIWTDGAVSPDEALVRAATHMRDHFSPLVPERGEEEEEEVEVAGEGFLQESLAKPLEELPLPARAINALKNAEIAVVADLVQKTDQDLEGVKNLGSKSIEEIKTALAALGLSLGMRIDPNLLGALGRGRNEARQGGVQARARHRSPVGAVPELLVALFRHERIDHGVQGQAIRGRGHLVTLAKRDTLHARRQALVMVPDPIVVKKLFDSIAARSGDRRGGYTRILRAGSRPGDRAPMAILELVDRLETPTEKGKTDAKGERKSESAGAAKGKRKRAAAGAG